MNSFSVRRLSSKGFLVLAFLPNLFGLIAFITFLMKDESEESPRAIIGTASCCKLADPESLSSMMAKNSLAN